MSKGATDERGCDGKGWRSEDRCYKFKSDVKFKGSSRRAGLRPAPATVAGGDNRRSTQPELRGYFDALSIKALMLDFSLVKSSSCRYIMWPAP